LLRFLIPRNLLPHVSAVLTEAEHLLDRAESTGIIPQPNDYRSVLSPYIVRNRRAFFLLIRLLTDQRSCASEFLQMESHRAPGILHQLWLAVWYGRTCRLYMLSLRVEAIKIIIEVCLEYSPPLSSYSMIDGERL
jgi:hypothetical protein